MKTRTKLVVSMVVLTVSSVSQADWIGDFYSSAGAAANVTAPQAIATQSVVGYSGGGMSWRVPTRNFQPLTITPPSLKAGCNGIDMYLGSYSFPNKDEFVQALRNFGQAAVGYFFELALRTMAPEIAVTLDVINDIAQRVNQFSMNSCQLAKGAVGNLAEQFGVSATKDASGFGVAAGEYVDQFAANFDLKTDFKKTMEEKYKQNYAKAQSLVTSADRGKFDPVKVNVLRYALDYSDATKKYTDDEKDLMMSLVGPTLIIASKVDSDGNPSPSVYGKGATIAFAQIVGQNFSGATDTFDVLTCPDAECLNPTVSTETFKSFSVRIGEAVQRIRENIKNRTVGSPLNPEHIMVLKLSSVPIYRAAAMAESVGISQVLGGQMVNDLIDYAAVDAAMNLVVHYLTATDKALGVVAPKIDKIYHPQLEEMRERIQNIKTDMHRQVTQFYKQKGDPYLKIEQLDKAERAMYANLNVMLAANAHFGR